MTNKPVNGRLVRMRGLSILASAFVLAATGALAESAAPVEEMIVTGSYIKGSAEDAALPVSVLSQQDLLDVGAPTVLELVRNLNVTSGNEGETNQFDNGRTPGGVGSVSINLRGLGAARTLVMLNSHRLVATEQGGVDIAGIPTSAIGRLELLKDGAAALYGSDAIGGVVNMITRAGFEGFEFQVSEQFVEESDGDHNVAGVFGWSGEDSNFMVAVEWDRRSELRAIDRDWAIKDRLDNLFGGYSSTSNPGNIVRANADGSAPLAALTANTTPDPGCAVLLGARAAGCSFQFTQFDNLVEPQDTYKSYAEYNYTINDNHSLHLEAMYSSMQMHHWKTSPSYPPQSLYTADRFIPATHPGLVALRAVNPALDTFVGTRPGVYSLSRYLGAAGLFGGPQQGVRETDTYGYGGKLEGSLFGDAVDYTLSANYSTRKRHTSGQDMYVERMAFALDGLGGPACNPSTGVRGVGGCQYFNPFSTAVRESFVRGATNPQYNAAVANSPEMVRWLYGKQNYQARNELLVIDAVVSGETPYQLGGGPVALAVGVQSRTEKYQLELNDLTNVDESPCQFNNPFSVTIGNVSQAAYDACQNGLTTATGPLAFLSGTRNVNTSRKIYALFGEMKLPISDTLDAQLALRFEDYGGDVGSTLDPKLAVRWQATEWLAVRGSISTTFRGPPQSTQSGRATALVNFAAAQAYKAVDFIGNPDLKAEKAVARNLGVIVQLGGLYASLDYWKFDVEDPFIVENPNQIEVAYRTGLCANGGANQNTERCQGLRAHVFPLGVAPALLERVDTNYLNGGRFTTSGVDAFAQYDFEDTVLGGELSVGADATYTNDYVASDFVDINDILLAPGGDFSGRLNDGTPLTPKPRLKGTVFTRYVNGSHRLTTNIRYVDKYKDPLPRFVAHNFNYVDQHVTVDMTYSVGLLDDKLNVTASVFNLLDNDPPRVAQALNYDPFTHSATGRMFKVGLTYTLGDE